MTLPQLCPFLSHAWLPYILGFCHNGLALNPSKSEGHIARHPTTSQFLSYSSWHPNRQLLSTYI